MFNFDVNKLVSDLQPAVDKIASSLGTTGQQLLEIGIRGKVAEGISEAIIAVLFLLVCLPAGIWMISKGRNAFRDHDGEVAFVWVFFGGCTVFLGALIGLISMRNAVMDLVAPQYMLLMDVKNVLIK